MASPVVLHLKKVISPRLSPLNKLKKISNFSAQNFPKHSNSLVPPIDYFNVENAGTNCARRLFGDIKKPAVVNCQSLELNKLDKKEPRIPLLTVNEEATSCIKSPYSGKKLCFSDTKHVLGKGSFGTVILAEFKGKLVAAKVMNRAGQSTIKNELNALHLKHQNVIEVLEIIVNPQVGFGLVLMELWSQQTLQSIIGQAEKVHTRIKLRYILDVSLGLEYCHSQDILHLDVKPKNILVNKFSKRCKICDFGNSFNLKKNEPQTDWSKQGTVKYCSPELLKGEKPTGKSDVYSLGITIWQLLHEEIPYRGLDNDILVYQVVSKNFRPNSSNLESTKSNHEISALSELYEKCWVWDPCIRPSMSQIVKSLENITVAENV